MAIATVGIQVDICCALRSLATLILDCLKFQFSGFKHSFGEGKNSEKGQFKSRNTISQKNIKRC